jgi:hypothetical protein
MLSCSVQYNEQLKLSFKRKKTYKRAGEFSEFRSELEIRPPFSRESKHLICKYRSTVMNNVTNEMQNTIA